jgi:hypothetical protein
MGNCNRGRAVKEVPIYDVLRKRLIEIPADFKIVAAAVQLYQDEGFVLVIPGNIEGKIAFHRYMAEKDRQSWRERLLSDHDRDASEIKADRDEAFALVPDLPDIVQPAEQPEENAGFKDGYENLPEPTDDEEDDGPAWSEPWPPPVIKTPAPGGRKRGQPRQPDTVRPRHAIRFFDLVGRRLGYGLWNGTVSLAFPWVCESEADALKARTEQDLQDWLYVGSRCTHSRRVAVAYRALPKPIHWATTLCPDCGFHDERDPADSLKSRGHAVFQWGPPPWPWDT